eukprot:3849-Amphidinium_carterae.2
MAALLQRLAALISHTLVLLGAHVGTRPHPSTEGEALPNLRLRHLVISIGAADDYAHSFKSRGPLRHGMASLRASVDGLRSSTRTGAMDAWVRGQWRTEPLLQVVPYVANVQHDGNVCTKLTAHLLEHLCHMSHGRETYKLDSTAQALTSSLVCHRSRVEACV